MPVARKVEDAASNATALWLTADEWVPNNQKLPMILYRAAVSGQPRDPAAAFEHLFGRNGWSPEWRNGVYPFHHYHSTAHEVLGFAAGTARLLLGGPNGHEVVVAPGRLRPAASGHRDIAASKRARTFSWLALIHPASSGISAGALLRNPPGRRCRCCHSRNQTPCWGRTVRCSPIGRL